METLVDKRNIVDRFKNWANDLIIADLDTRRNNFGILCCNIQGDFNIGSVIRNNNAFLGREVIIYGKKRYDRRGCVGTYKYEHLKHVKLEDNLELAISKYDQVIGVDNIDSAEPIDNQQWNYNKKTLFCFGEEGSGLPQNVLDICNKIVYIKQMGSVRSINVGCASAIILFHYCQGLK